MRFHRRFSAAALVFMMAFSPSVVFPNSAHADKLRLPVAESNLFILDVSGSTDSVALWKNLRVSVTSKLSQPFGHPVANSIDKKLPVYVSITSVSKNSQNSPVFSIVTKSQVAKLWGAIEQVFPKSTEARLEKITSEIFGESGVWASQARIFARSAIVVPSAAACRSSTINSINKGPFLRSTNQANKAVLAGAICESLISIGKSLKQADDYFASPVCDPKAVCSDVAGAIYRASSLAADLALEKRDEVNGREVNNKLCIAIASDMLNESPGMTKTSNLNSKHIALTAVSTEKAKEAGMSAARSIGVQFSPEVETRVVMVGIGTGPNPIALDRNSYLLAYWGGFWSASGIKQTKQAQSLNKACS